jgi:hypothetical protein
MWPSGEICVSITGYSIHFHFFKFKSHFFDQGGRSTFYQLSPDWRSRLGAAGLLRWRFCASAGASHLPNIQVFPQTIMLRPATRFSLNRRTFIAHGVTFQNMLQTQHAASGHYSYSIHPRG